MFAAGFFSLLLIAAGLACFAATNRVLWWHVPVALGMAGAIALVMAAARSTYRIEEEFAPLALMATILVIGALIIGVTVGRKLTKLPPE